MGTIREFASKKRNLELTCLGHAVGSADLSVCPTAILTHIQSRPNLELASGNCRASLGRHSNLKGKKWNPQALACLRNAGSYSAQSSRSTVASQLPAS